MSEATYRFEVSKSKRAGCQAAPCKKDKVKIEKGVLRFGTLVYYPGLESPAWKWKHWGCVTPLQLANIVGQLGGADVIDWHDHDFFDILDGYDEVTPEMQETIRRALQQGHVDDQDWNGASFHTYQELRTGTNNFQDPEFNRPGMKGMKRRTPKKKVEEHNEDIGSEGSFVSPKPKKSQGKKSKKEEEDEENMGHNGSPLPPNPKKSRGRKFKKEELDVDELADDIPHPKQKTSKKRKSSETEEGDDAQELLKKPKRASRAKKVKKEEETDEEEAPAVKPEPKSRSRAKKVKQPVKRSRARNVKKEEEDNDDAEDQLAAVKNEDEEKTEHIISEHSIKREKRPRAPAKVKAEQDVLESVEEDEKPTLVKDKKSRTKMKTNTKTKEEAPEDAVAPKINPVDFKTDGSTEVKMENVPQHEEEEEEEQMAVNNEIEPEKPKRGRERGKAAASTSTTATATKAKTQGKAKAAEEAPAPEPSNAKTKGRAKKARA